jgi:hypothetical protein
MKQPFFLFYFLLCWNINLLAQEKNIDGSYYDEVGFEIKITDNHFYYIEEQKHMRLWYTDTLAICTYEWVDKNFIKINSKSPTEILLPEMKITQSFDSTLHDSITVVFQMVLPFNTLDPAEFKTSETVVVQLREKSLYSSMAELRACCSSFPE